MDNPRYPRTSDVTESDSNGVVLRPTDVELLRRRRVFPTRLGPSIRCGRRWILFGPNDIGKPSLAQRMSARGFPSEDEVDVRGPLCRRT